MGRVSLLQFVVFYIWGSTAYDVHSEELLIVRGNGQYAPYELTRDGELIGFHIDLIKSVAHRANMRVVFKSYPWKRAVHMLKNGEADAITYLGRNREREKFTYYFEGNILSYVRNHFIVSKSSDIKYEGSLENLTGFKLGVVRGFMYGEMFTNADYLTKYEVNKRELMVAMLNRGRLDVGLLNPLKLENKFTDTNPLVDFKILEPPLSEIPNYLGFSKLRNKEQVGRAFAKHMAEFKNTELFESLLEEYGLSRL